MHVTSLDVAEQGVHGAVYMAMEVSVPYKIMSQYVDANQIFSLFSSNAALADSSILAFYL